VRGEKKVNRACLRKKEVNMPDRKSEEKDICLIAGDGKVWVKRRRGRAKRGGGKGVRCESRKGSSRVEGKRVDRAYSTERWGGAVAFGKKECSTVSQFLVEREA